jgi:hypothetical protein
LEFDRFLLSRQYERDVIGLLEVFSNVSFAFDKGDVAAVERLAQTVLLTMSQSARPSARSTSGT